MTQNRPFLVATEERAKLPILIVDKKGEIGKALATELCSQFLVVLVTEKEEKAHDNVIFIPHHRKIPMIPDNVYSHIFVVYNGEKEFLDMLSSFLQKARETQAKLLFITSLLYSNKNLFSQLNKLTYEKLHVILYGETFGSQSTEKNEMNFFIKQAKAYGRIEIPNEGLNRLYPILFTDVLKVILAVGFGTERWKRLVFAFPHHSITEISVARMFQKIHPWIKIDFKKQKGHTSKYVIPPDGGYYFVNYSLEDRLKELDLSQDITISQIPQKNHKLVIPDPEAKQKRFIIVGVLFFSLFIAPFILIFFLAISGAGFLTLSLKQAEQGKIQNAQLSARVSQVSFKATETLIPSLFLASLFVPQQEVQFLERIQTGREAVETELEMLEAFGRLQAIYEQKSLDPKDDFLQSLATIKNALLTLQKMKAEGKLPQSVTQKTEKLEGILSLVEGTIDTWPAVFGFEGKRTYLILFQNNMELRPGGGFIGSYGLVSVENGKMGKMQIYDVYDADGKLKVHVEPPYGLRRYLGASHWFLRDSNYDIDFTKNAEKVAQFLQLEMNQKVDGVIALDTTFLRNLLMVLGPVKVTDYKETVNAENFYLLTQTHAEKAFFPGSTQKKDFLKSLTNAMMVDFEKNNFSYEKLLQQAEISLRQKHLLVGFADQGIQTVYTVNGFSSALRDGRQQKPNTVLDFVGVIDANVGANKANYYIKRSLTQQVTIDSAGELYATAEATYRNTSTRKSPFGGEYKNYVRFVLPVNAKLQDVFFDNKQQSIVSAVTDPSVFTKKTFVPSSELEIEQTEEEGKNVVGFFLSVPSGATKTVAVSYTISNAVDLSKPAFTYTLRLFKQPGTIEDPYTVSFAYPATCKLIDNEKSVSDLGGKAVYETLLSEDKDVTLSFSQK